MYQRALQGYKKILDSDKIIIYIPALNTIWNLGSFFESQADITKARTMYSKALIRYEKVFGPDHLESRTMQDKLSALDVVIESRTLVEVKDLVDNLQKASLHLSVKETPLKSKRHKLFRKLDIR